MGKGLLYQSHITPGVRCVAVCDSRIERCTSALDWLGVPYEVVANHNVMMDAINRGLVAVCKTGSWISECDAVDAVVEASSSIVHAIEYACIALEHRKHLVLMNSEIDLLFGPVLSHIARNQGVVCTSCDGDQYGVLKNIIDNIKLWGFELVMAGNIKGYLDRYANPTTIINEADKRNLDYQMCTSYTDGTKLNIEMAIIANACGLVTKRAGMHGPRASHVTEVFERLDLDSLWEDRKPFVDYLLGAEPGGGVFVIGYCDNSYQKGMLSYYKMGAGPYYLFYRPYHLCHIEAIGTVIKAVRQGSCFLSPKFGFQTNVYAYAKRDLKTGEILDGIGGYRCYGMIENAEQNRVVPGLPIALANDVALKRCVFKDEKITMNDVIYDPLRVDFKRYAESLVYGGAKDEKPRSEQVVF